MEYRFFFADSLIYSITHILIIHTLAYALIHTLMHTLTHTLMHAANYAAVYSLTPEISAL